MAEAAAHVEPVDPAPRCTPVTTRSIVYTSGTTGKPKGAVHTHASLLAGVASLVTAWGWQPDDRLILALPLFHVHGLCAGLFGTLAAGASAVLFDRFDEPAVLDAAADEHHVLRRPHHVPPARRFGPGRASSAALRLCVSGSAPLAADLWHRCTRAGSVVLERYGMTETLLTLSNPLRANAVPARSGCRCPGVDARVDDADERRRGRAARARPVALPRLLGPTDAPTARRVVRHRRPGVGGRRRLRHHPGPAHRADHHGRPQRVPGRGRGRPGPPPVVAEVAVVGVPSAEWGETVVAFVVGASRPAVARTSWPRGARPVQVPARGAPGRRAAAQRLGKVVRRDLR